ncbi:MAG: hypothetical protein KGH54_03005 [Candidatus Micrarchaeota archaeon]|nr:hypothetical protein [Candidatus Micrarchaeota archaeon]
MKLAIIDTSSILFGLANKIDPFERLKESFPEYKIAVSQGVVRELAEMSGSRKKQKVQAKIGLALIKKHLVTVLKGEGYVDSWILANVKKWDCIVCTNDVELKGKLKSIGAKAVSLARSGMLR